MRTDFKICCWVCIEVSGLQTEIEWFYENYKNERIRKFQGFIFRSKIIKINWNLKKMRFILSTNVWTFKKNLTFNLDHTFEVWKMLQIKYRLRSITYLLEAFHVKIGAVPQPEKACSQEKQKHQCKINGLAHGYIQNNKKIMFQ